jgi:hypothetical protein
MDRAISVDSWWIFLHAGVGTSLVAPLPLVVAATAAGLR